MFCIAIICFTKCAEPYCGSACIFFFLYSSLCLVTLLFLSPLTLTELIYIFFLCTNHKSISCLLFFAMRIQCIARWCESRAKVVPRASCLARTFYCPHQWIKKNNFSQPSQYNFFLTFPILYLQLSIFFYLAIKSSLTLWPLTKTNLISSLL